MAGVGEASAIVALITTAGKLSQAVIDIAGRYKAAKRQIESFGLEVANLGNVLDQLHRLYDNDELEIGTDVRTEVLNMAGQCSDLFSELENYRSTLYSRAGSVHNLTFRGKTKWVFNATELQYLRARVESMKTNLLLMMTMQCLHGIQSQISNTALLENTKQINLLSIQSSACVQRLERLEKKIMLPTQNSSAEQAINRLSIACIDTASEARSARDSILSLFGHQSYYDNITEPRPPGSRALATPESDVNLPTQMQDTQARASTLIEDYLSRDSPHGTDGDREELEIDENEESPNNSSTDEEGESSDQQPTGVRRQSIDSYLDQGAKSNRTPSPYDMSKPIRVGIKDPCQLVLARALKGYGSEAPWTDYDLHIMYGDKEYCCALDEPVLATLKSLDKQGLSPTSVIRKRRILHVWPPSEQSVEADLNGEPF